MANELGDIDHHSWRRDSAGWAARLALYSPSRLAKARWAHKGDAVAAARRQSVVPSVGWMVHRETLDKPAGPGNPQRITGVRSMRWLGFQPESSGRGLLCQAWGSRKGSTLKAEGSWLNLLILK